MDADVGGEMRSREHDGEPAGDVLLVEREGFSRKQDEWIEDGAPGDVIFVDRVIKMLGTDRVFGEQH